MHTIWWNLVSRLNITGTRLESHAELDRGTLGEPFDGYVGEASGSMDILACSRGRRNW